MSQKIFFLKLFGLYNITIVRTSVKKYVSLKFYVGFMKIKCIFSIMQCDWWNEGDNAFNHKNKWYNISPYTWWREWLELQMLIKCKNSINKPNSNNHDDMGSDDDDEFGPPILFE